MKLANVVGEGDVVPQGLSFSWRKYPTSFTPFETPWDRMAYAFDIFFRLGETMVRFQFRTSTRLTKADGFERQAIPCSKTMPLAGRWEKFLWLIRWYRADGPRRIPRIHRICVCGWPMLYHAGGVKVADWKYISTGKEAERQDA